MTARFSLRLNNDLTPDTYRRVAVIADAAGIEQLWISHDLRFHSAPALIADLAARTSTIRLGIGLHNPYTVHPVELAMIASTLDELTEGRFDLGLGAGAAGFLELVGIERSTPMRVMRDTLTGIRQLLAGEPVTVDGWDPELRLMRPAPRVGLWLGATGPRMRGLAGELADGVLALALPPQVHERITAECAAGQLERQNPVGPDIPMCVWLSLDNDLARADAALAEKLELYGPELGADLLADARLTAADFTPVPTPLPDTLRNLAVVGDPTMVTARCRELLSTGIEHLSFGPPLGPDPVTATEVLAESVLPQLRG